MKKVLVAGIIFVVLGLAILAGAYFVSGGDLSKLSTTKFETTTHTPDGAFRDLEISADAANVALKPSEDGRCSVVCVEPEKAPVTVSVENGTLKISAADHRAWYEKISLFTRLPSVTVYLPAETYNTLAIADDTGRLSVSDAFTFESVTIATDTAAVQFGASVTGKLAISSHTGDINVQGIRAGEMAISVSTGRVRIGSAVCEGDISVDVSTGKAELTDVRCKNLTSRGDTGSITLKDVVAEEHFSIERDTGDVRFDSCDAADITVKTDTGDVTGSLRSEKIFVTRTDTGDVRVPGTTSGGRCEITTDTGDIRIEISGGR